MKVKLTGIRPYDPEIDGDWDEELQNYRALLEQVPYPVEVEADNNYPHAMNLTRYIKDDESPEDFQYWGLTWFDYEKIKD